MIAAEADQTANRVCKSLSPPAAAATTHRLTRSDAANLFHTPAATTRDIGTMRSWGGERGLQKQIYYSSSYQNLLTFQYSKDMMFRL